MNWHERGCKPDIRTFDGSSPCCLSCGNMAPEALAPSEVERLFPSFPIGEPTAGERLNLRWPTVKFKPSAADAATEQDVNSDRFGALSLGNDSESQVQTTKAKSIQIYRPVVGRQLRLLRLSQPSSPSDPLHGRLETADLREHPHYEALSYTWADSNGDASKCKVIYLGDSWAVFPITANCEAALRRLRKPPWDRLLWVDAICIDQSDTRERTHQVGIMQHIYATAEEVVIYLGEALMERDDLVTLVRMPYFSRIWIIQEVAAARKATVIYGPHNMDWAEFREKSLNQLAQGMELDARNTNLQWFRHAERFKLLHLETGLYNVLRDTSYCEASDARDKVFAILGLFMDAAFEGFSADYSLSVCEILAGLSAHLLTGSPYHFEFLLSLAMEHQTLPGLPSWALDWSSLQAAPSTPLPTAYLLGPSYSWFPSEGSFNPMFSWPDQLTEGSDRRKMPLFNKTGVMLTTGIPYLRLKGRCAKSRRLSGAQYSHHVSIGRSSLVLSNKATKDGDEIWLLKDISSFVHLRKRGNTEKYCLVSHCSVNYPKEWLKEFGLIWKLMVWEWLLWPPRVRSEADPWLLSKKSRWLSRDPWTAVNNVCVAVRRLHRTELRCWMRRLIWKAVYTLGVQRVEDPAAVGPATSIAARRFMTASARIVEYGRARRADVGKMLAVALGELADNNNARKTLETYRAALEDHGLVECEPITIRETILSWLTKAPDDSTRQSVVDLDFFRLNVLMRLDLKTRCEIALASSISDTKNPGPELSVSSQGRTVPIKSRRRHVNELVRAFEAVCRTPYDQYFVDPAEARRDLARQMFGVELAQNVDRVVVKRMRTDKAQWGRVLRFVRETEEGVLPFADVFADQPPSFRAWLSAEGAMWDLSSYEFPIDIV